jgi:hypothetical protein
VEYGNESPHLTWIDLVPMLYAVTDIQILNKNKNFKKLNIFTLIKSNKNENSDRSTKVNRQEGERKTRD